MCIYAGHILNLFKKKLWKEDNFNDLYSILSFRLTFL